jgi:hypothetical protein
MTFGKALRHDRFFYRKVIVFSDNGTFSAPFVSAIWVKERQFASKTRRAHSQKPIKMAFSQNCTEMYRESTFVFSRQRNYCSVVGAEIIRQILRYIFHSPAASRHSSKPSRESQEASERAKEGVKFYGLSCAYGSAMHFSRAEEKLRQVKNT